jgi:hypothetical protein
MQKPIPKITEAKRTQGVVQEVGWALGSNPNTTQKRKRKRKMKGVIRSWTEQW